MADEGFPTPEDQHVGIDVPPTPEDINGTKSAPETKQDIGHVSIEVATPDDADKADDPQHAENDGRWDKRKAETLAPVLEADSSVQWNLSQIGKDQNLLGASENEDDGQSFNSRSYLDRMEQKYEDAAAEGYPLSEADQKDLDDARELFTATKGSQEDRVQAQLEKNQKLAKLTAERVISPYEELFDSNPDKYADMPTSEFIGLGREFEELSDDISMIEHGLNPDEGSKQDYDGIGATIKYFENCLDDKSGPYGVDAKQEVLTAVCLTLNKGLMNRTIIHDVNELFNDNIDNKFDMSPRQHIQSYIDFLNKYREQAEAKIAELTKKRQEMLGESAPVETAGAES